MLSRLAQFSPDHRVEIIKSLTAWLAARSGGEIPRRLAALELPPTMATAPPDPFYVQKRAYAAYKDEFADFED